MEDSTGKPPEIEETLDEHRACMGMVAEIEECLDQHPEPAGEWLARLCKGLTQLGETLGTHFAAEEKGPMFTRLPVTQPHFAGRLEKLKTEHDGILDRARKVLDRANALTDEARSYELRELNAQTQLLVATIRRHEAEENEIVLSAHWDEVGVGD